MARFNVLDYNQHFMAKIGIHSYRLTDPSNEFFKTPSAYLILLILSVFSISSSAAFVYKNTDHFEAALQAIFVIIAGVQCTGMYLSIGLKMEKVKKLQIELQKLVDDGNIIHHGFLRGIFHNFIHIHSVREYEISKIYWDSEKKCRKFTKLLTCNYLILLVIVFMALFVYSIYFIAKGNFDPAALPLPYYMVVPFNTQTFSGWYLLWLVFILVSIFVFYI